VIRTELCEMLDIKYPIIQAGMGPFSTTYLAAAVSNAGGMGTLSIPGITTDPEVGGRRYRENIRTLLKLTDKNFAANIPVGTRIYPQFLKTTDAYIDAVIDEKMNNPEARKRFKLLITSAGNPERYIEKIKDSGLIHFHVVSSAYHAKKVEKMGVDGVIASGYEMGGHTHRADRVVHTMILVPQVTDEVDIPVVASGGFCDAKSFVAALALGAVGVQMGTRFICTKECEFHESYKKMYR